MSGRAAFYVDGFNLFHAIDELNQPHLKWLNLVALANRIVPSRSEYISRVVHCSAIPQPKSSNDVVGQERKDTHLLYIDALKLTGVQCKIGHFINEEITCRKSACGHKWEKAGEKQGDVNVAISLIDDAHMDIFDHAYLVTNDTDQVATVQLFVDRFIERGKILTIVNPPRPANTHLPQYRHVRRPHSHFERFSNNVDQRQITISDIENSLFPHVSLIDKTSVRRPQKYNVPSGWAIPWPDVKHISKYAPPQEPGELAKIA